MFGRTSRNLLLILALALYSLGNAQATQPSHSPAEPSAAVHSISSYLRDIAVAGRLSDLRWPDFSHHRAEFERVYEASQFAPVWLNEGRPTPQALALIQAFEASREKGLIPDDYDASRWPGRTTALKHTSNAEAEARFDAALTVSAIRYMSDLHNGRVDPRYFKFGIKVQQRDYDLPQFISRDVEHAPDIAAVLHEVEPPYSGYRRTEIALQHYLQLLQQGDGPRVPEVRQPVAAGGAYSGIPELALRLKLLGDLPQDAAVDTDSQTFTGPLVTAVKHFQVRDGLEPNGRLTQETLRQLNVPVAMRVQQLDDALERWRWLPPSFPQPPVVVNIPEFVLRVFAKDQKVALRMNVIVGKAYQHKTPVFAKDMRYIVFRPYWNVPPSIVRGEVVPAIEKNRNYIASKNFEVTDHSGKVITSGTISDSVLAQLRAGRLSVRQKPGPDNALGLVKFLFPNEHSVYLHSTPAPQLFSQARRDFSHGCIRVQKPAELAAYILRNQPPWTLEKVRAAMQSGPNNQQVNLAVPVPVLILYETAVVEEDGTVHFFSDIYGYDKLLDAELAKGRPYPN